LDEQDTAVVLGREQQRMEEEVEAAQHQVEVIGEILSEMERCQSGASASGLPEKELVYRRLKAQFPEEYLLYNLADAALSQVHSCWLVVPHSAGTPMSCVGAEGFFHALAFY
jgi:tuftelin-interacting protein 11